VSGSALKKPWVLVAIGVLLVFAVTAVVGFAVAMSGVVPIQASAGHWPITSWFLHTSMKRSTAFHSMGIEVPPLDDAGLILKGAGHYESGCRPCHGAPGPRRPEVPRWMTPDPPDLAEAVAGWDPEDLFYVVKHGIKLTGMPAYPAQTRDDEVWAVTAFLVALPDLSPLEYRRLVFGDEVPAPALGSEDELILRQSVPLEVGETCGRCHGRDGLGRGEGVFPQLAGQSREYLEAAMIAYATGTRHSGIMESLAVGLSEDVLRDLADFYAAMPRPAHPRATAEPPDPAAAARGERIARDGIPERKIPSCADCHGPVSPGEPPRNPRYPVLDGMYAEYLELQLTLFAEGNRGGSDYAHLMREFAPRLEEGERRDVAAYYAGRGAGDGAGGLGGGGESGENRDAGAAPSPAGR
jgi:cytochrome c553